MLIHEDKCSKKPKDKSKSEITCPVTDCGLVTVITSLESHLQEAHEDDIEEVDRKYNLEIPVSATKSNKRNFHGKVSECSSLHPNYGFFKM